MGILSPYIRNVTEEDKRLPKFSYSKMEVFKNCPMKYKIRYYENKYSEDVALHLELGTLCHYVLEQKGIMLKNDNKVNYNKLLNILYKGILVSDNKTNNRIMGVDELKKKYFDKWNVKSSNSDKTYDEKIEIFIKVLHNEMDDEEWQPAYFEYPFEFVWNDKYILHGFIDRIDVMRKQNPDGTTSTEYRVIDYKTSKKVFDDSKLPTSLQFGIYALAVLNDFGKLPILYEYHFVFLNTAQYAMTKGYQKRLLELLNKSFEAIENCAQKNLFIPRPSPLCYWCPYCKDNPEAGRYKDECEYHSLWTPNNATFEVNKKWNAIETKPEQLKKKTSVKRKLVF